MKSILARSTHFILLIGALLAIPLIADDSPWDFNGLLTVDPASLDNLNLLTRAHALEQEYQRYHQVNGIMWTAMFSPEDNHFPRYYGNGADNALFTGFYLAATVYRFMVTLDEVDLDTVLETLRGLHILSHISGTPGVIARNAFPIDNAEKWRYPKAWQRRIERGFIYKSPENVADVLNSAHNYPQMIFYTRSTKDQLTGILFGLSVALYNLKIIKLDELPHLEKKVIRCLNIIDGIGSDIFARLKSKRFKIKDHHNTTGTTAAKVSGLLKLQLFALYKEILKTRGDLYASEYEQFIKTYKEQFRKSLIFDGLENCLQSIMGGYYAWNLRFARIYSVWLLENDPKRKDKTVKYTRRRIWKYVKHHENTHFIFLYNHMKGESFVNLEAGIFSLKRLYFRPMRSWNSPLAGKEKRPNFIRRLLRADKKFVIPSHLRKFSRYYLWQKSPYKVGKHTDHAGAQRSPGLSYLLPYWMGRYCGFLSEP